MRAEGGQAAAGPEAPAAPAYTVRVASPADAVALRALRLEALQQHPEAFGADYERAASQPASEWAERIETGLAAAQEVICIAEANAQLVGLTGLARGRSAKMRHGAVVWGVYVTPAWRGRRVAEALIGACLAWGRAHGVRVARLGVITGNTAAVRCYARCGFRVYGLEPKVFHDAGVDYDELLMAMEL